MQVVGPSMTNKLDTNRPYYLADWQVDSGANRLRKGDIEVKLESKVMAVLDYLAQHQGELVTREALEHAIWGKTIVGYDALTSSIAKLRKALGDDPRQPEFIDTVSKKGYRLIAMLRVVDPGEASQPAADPKIWPEHARQQGINSWAIRIGLLILAVILVSTVFLMTDFEESEYTPTTVTGHPSIVVLPFTNLSGDPQQDYFSDGVSADLTTALSKLSGLFVIAQSSANGYRDKSQNIKHVAELLGVNYVIDGSIRREQNRMRVNVHLIDTKNNIYLWSEKYDRERQHILDVQDEITANIVNALAVQLTADEKQRIAKRYTTSIDAYDDFLKGQARYFLHNKEGNSAAQAYYQQAVDRDDSFARAYSAMAMTYVAEHRFAWANANTHPLEIALHLAEKGVALDDELPQALWVLAYVHLFRREYGDAEVAANRAVTLDPNYADSYLTLAVCKLHFGMPEEALQRIRKAMLLNPDYPSAYASVLGQAYFYMGQYEKSVQFLHEAIERNINLLTPHVFLIVALSKLDKLDEAQWAAEQLKTISPDFSSANSVADLLAIQDANAMEDIKNNLRRVGL